MNKKSFIKQSSMAFIVRILGAMSGLAMNLVITRNLSVEQSGLFFLSFAICTSIGMLCTLGLTNAFIRFIGGEYSEKNWSNIKGIVISGITRTVLVSCIVAFALLSCDDLISNYIFSKPELSIVLESLLISIPAFSFYQLLCFAFQGVHKPLKSIFLQNIINQWIVVFSVYILVYTGRSLLGHDVARIYTLGALITCGVACFLWIRHNFIYVRANYTLLPEVYSSAKHLWLMMLMVMFVQNSGQLIVGIYVPVEEVAFFSVALRVSMLTSFVLIAVNLVAAPRFSASAKQGDYKELRVISLLCNRLMLILASPILIFMLTLPEYILGFFGEEYKKAAFLLQILVIGQFINVITGSVGFLLNMTGHEKDMKYVVLFSGPLALISSFILIPIYGTTGAAISTAFALSSQNLIAVLMVKKRLGFNTLNLWK